MLKPSVIKEIDQIADKAEVSRSQMIANLVDMGLEDAKLLDSLGFLYLSKLGRKAIEHLKNIKPQTESNEMQKK